MNLVTIRDPWFGPYLKATLASRGWGAPVITVGPLYTRILRLEHLENSGQKIVVQGLIERPCTHSYVSGTVDGAVEPPTEEFGWWYTQFEDGEYYAKLGTDPPTEPGEQLHELRMTLKVWKVGTGVSMVFELYRTMTTPEGSTVLENYGFTVSATVFTDRITGAETYGAWRISSTRDCSVDELSAEPAVCPYSGTPGDYLGPMTKFIEKFIDDLGRQVMSVPSYKVQRDRSIYKAIEDVALSNINWMEWAPELVHFNKVIKQLVGLFKGRWDIIGIIRKLANLHLMWKYVVGTNLMSLTDLLRMIKFLATNWKHVRDIILSGKMFGRGQKTLIVKSTGSQTITLINTAKLCYGPDLSSFDKITSRFSILGFAPQIGDIWDIIPYSFVLDWILPIGDAIYNAERLSLAQRLPLLSCVLGRKLIAEIQEGFAVGDHRFTMNLTYVRYQREVVDALPDNMWLGLSFQDPRKHSVTAIALIIQRTV